MGRKVFISVLGTGFYGKCRYVAGDFVSSETRFIQHATLEYLDVCNWTKDDAVYMLLTDKAKKENWDKTIVEREHFTIKEKIPYTGLEKVLEDMELPFAPTVLPIPEGKNEKEMWDIFGKLYDALQDGDELYFDLTHSFRYLPMLVLVFGNYAKFLKGAKINHISYGNYEARDIVENKAPIVDLLQLTSLQDWTFAAADYLENGNAARLTNLCTSSLKPILQNMKDLNKDAALLNSFAQQLNTVIEERQTCRGINIVRSDHLKKLKKTANQLSTVIIEPLKPVVEKIKHSLDQFDDQENVKNGFVAAQWCLSNGLYQQAATIFHENIITYFCMQEQLAWNVEEERGLVNTAFQVVANDIPEEEWKINVKNKDNFEAEKNRKKEIIKRVINNTLVKKVASSFEEMNNLRNDFNHSGMRNNPMSSATIKNKLSVLIDSILSLLV